MAAISGRESNPALTHAQAQTPMTSERVAGDIGFVIGGVIIQPLWMLPAAAMAGINKVKYVASEVKLAKLESKEAALNKQIEQIKAKGEEAPEVVEELNKLLADCRSKIEKQELKSQKYFQGFLGHAISLVPMAGVALSAIYLANVRPGQETGVRAGLEAIGTNLPLKNAIADTLLDPIYYYRDRPKKNDSVAEAVGDKTGDEKQRAIEGINASLTRECSRGGKYRALSDFGVVAEHVEVPRSEGKSSYLLFFRPANLDPNKPTIVMFHGNASGPGSMAHFVKDLKNDYNIIFATMGGYPDNNDGVKTTEATTYQDANAILEWAKKQPNVKGDIGVYGHSIGSTLASFCADAHGDRVKACCLNVPLGSLPNAAANMTHNCLPLAGSLVRGMARGALPKDEDVYGVTKGGKPYTLDQGDNHRKLAQARNDRTGLHLQTIMRTSDHIMSYGVGKSGEYEKSPALDLAREHGAECIVLDGDHNGRHGDSKSDRLDVKPVNDFFRRHLPPRLSVEPRPAAVPGQMEAISTVPGGGASAAVITRHILTNEAANKIGRNNPDKFIVFEDESNGKLKLQIGSNNVPINFDEDGTCHVGNLKNLKSAATLDAAVQEYLESFPVLPTQASPEDIRKALG